MTPDTILKLLDSLPAGSLFTLANTGGNYTATFRIAGDGKQAAVSALGRGSDPVMALEEAYNSALAKRQ